ncbi:hypothetical protein, partial [Nitrospirillum amazonense]|uniref:hypothetical protein n=1 Tax=Nitrospirillum amazonense TaxID=28077 RepID=UPI0024124F90
MQSQAPRQTDALPGDSLDQAARNGGDALARQQPPAYQPIDAATYPAARQAVATRGPQPSGQGAAPQGAAVANTGAP